MIPKNKGYLIKVIRDSADEFKFGQGPHAFMRKKDFWHASCEKWALNEMIFIIANCDDPIGVINEKMNKVLHMISNSQRFIDIQAHYLDACNFVLDILEGIDESF